jgi:SynChlorMet cassette protein ScmC
MNGSYVASQDVTPGRRDDPWSLLRELTGFAEVKDPGRGYSLQLGDGSRWWLAGSRRLAWLAAKLGAIMQLREGEPEDAHLMFFYERHTDGLRVQLPRMRAQGWTNLRHFFFLLSFHPGWRHFLGEYDEGNPKSSPYGLMCEALPAIYWESISRGGLPFHAALLEYQGHRVVLAAPGETGKSTCSRRVPPPWRALSDDEALVVLSPEGRYLVHPFPTWTDYLWERAENTWPVEDALPLAGIFFLEQAAEDDCLPLGGARAALAATGSAGQVMNRFLSWGEAGQARELRMVMFDNACALAKRVPAFRLRVSRTGRFWEKIEATLGWR